MTIQFAFNGDPTRIPAIGTRIALQPGLLFEVRGYGESVPIADRQVYPAGDGTMLELIGELIIPAGTPLKLFEELLGAPPSDEEEKES